MQACRWKTRPEDLGLGKETEKGTSLGDGGEDGVMICKCT